MKVSPEFIKAAKKYMKSMGMNTSNEGEVESIAMWLATTDEGVIDSLLDEEDEEDKARKKYGISTISVDNVSVDASGQMKTIAKKSKGRCSLSIKATDAPVVTTGVVVEAKEKENKQETIVLEKKPKTSPALQKMAKRAKQNRTSEQKSTNTTLKETAVNFDDRDGTAKWKEMFEYARKQSDRAKVQKKIESLADDDYYNLSKNVPEEDWAYIDDAEWEKDWAEYEREQKALQKRITRYRKREATLFGGGDVDTITMANGETRIKSSSAYSAKDFNVNKIRTKQQMKQSAFLRYLWKRTISGAANNRNVVDTAQQELQKTRQQLEGLLKQKEAQLKSQLKQKETEFARTMGVKFHAVTGNLQVKKIRKPVSRKNVSAASRMEIRGIENLFNPQMQTYAIIEQVTPSGKKIKIPTYDKIVRAKKTSVKIPKGMFFAGVVDEYYPSVIAAVFFQMLVSNTPLDEDYTYVYEYETPVRKRRKMYTTEPYEDIISGKTTNVRIIKDIEELKEEYVDTMQTRKVKKIIHHKADKEAVRDSWVLHFKGMDFYSSDPNIKDCFVKKSDYDSIDRLAQYIYEKVKDSNNGNNAFSYENTNPRWEMLEYGYYKNEESKIRIGTPYGYKHGVKGHYSIQAPYGYVRLTEAWWENMKASHRRFDFLENFVKKNSLDVSRIQKKTLEKLKQFDSSINTSNLDWSNFVMAGV